MPVKIIYLLVRRILGLAVLISRSDLAKDAELLVLRHEKVCVPRTLSMSCDQAVFVDHATDASVSPDVVSLKIDRFG
jgi:hypothetical protein